jgi:hypothetical protein
MLVNPDTSSLGGKNCTGINSQEESGMLLVATNIPKSDFFFDDNKFRTYEHNDDDVYIKWSIKNKMQGRNKNDKRKAHIGCLPLLIMISSI